ncbi:hypothetical protein RRG08_028669 [Elysia crispata]|uniref:Uncharacterized protein n=1 Tax=Elysia crispata TaxID=231223 RepID=A0AAE0ZCV0_9GAST|nr:hypothetical protein RRG08_028669 [Elysia crispata]
MSSALTPVFPHYRSSSSLDLDLDGRPSSSSLQARDNPARPVVIVCLSLADHWRVPPSSLEDQAPSSTHGASSLVAP